MAQPPRDEELRATGGRQASLLAAARSGARRRAASARIDDLLALHLEARRARGDDRFALDVHAISPTDESADGVLALAGELLVWDRTAADPPGATNAELALRALADAGIGAAIDSLVTPRARRLRLTPSGDRGKDRDLLAEALVTLATAGFRVSFDHAFIDNAFEALFEPIRPFMTSKGLAPPVRATGPLPVRPPAATGADRVKVAVIDTGAESQRDDGAGRWRDDGYLRTVSGDDDPATDEFRRPGRLTPGAGHGTLVAGIIEMVAPAAEVRSFRAMHLGLGSEENVAKALAAAADWGAQVVNLSLGAPSLPQHAPLAIEDALAHLPADVLVVAAAGNSGSQALHFPAAFKRVIAVGATDPDFRPAAFSNRGYWVDVSTRGTGIAAPYTQGTVDLVDRDGNDVGDVTFTGTDPIAAVTGTSFAAPQVAGRLAQLLAEGVPASEALARLTRGGTAEPDFGVVVRLLDP